MYQVMRVRAVLALMIGMVGLTLTSRGAGAASNATPGEIQLKDQWVQSVLLNSDAKALPPFTFKLGGKDSNDLLPTWEKKVAERKIDDNRTEHTIVWKDPQSGMQLTCTIVDYSDYPTVEWTLRFENVGQSDTPILNYVFALDTKIKAAPSEAVLHSFSGSAASSGDYQPHHTKLGNDFKGVLYSDGPSSQETFPYWNLETASGQGIIGAVGWSGSWRARLERAGDGDLHLYAGMTTIETTLHAGEHIRSPMMVQQFWKGGDWIDSQNVWRHWMVDHNIPREKGNHVPDPLTYTCVDDAFPGMHSNAKGEIDSMNRYIAHGLKFDYWWIDAGWYPSRGDWTDTGDWRPDPDRYPHGLREVSDAAHKNGMKMIVWFEPERVRPGTWMAEHHPDFLIGAPQGERLLNWGNPAALQWMTKHISELITAQGIDLYRQDYNINPSGIWRECDKPGRIGYTEAKYVEGFYAYWDGLQKDHPGMLIDSCSGGGRRNDLEVMRRAVPLLRSDYRFEPHGTQGHTYGISFWLPFNGTGCNPGDEYHLRSHFCPGFGFGGPNGDPNFDYETRKKMDKEYRSISDSMVVGDYYPLCEWSTAVDVWMAWQFNRPDLKHGFVQAFRHEKNNDPVMHFKLRGLDPSATYELKISDVDATPKVTGKELMETGFEVKLDKQASAATIAYKQLP